MRILHVFDHSLPLHSGYSFRSLAILQQQQALGWQVMALTGPKQGTCSQQAETIAGCDFVRSPALRGLWQQPIVEQVAVIRSLQQQLKRLIKQWQPDIIHAHSPALNGLAASQQAKKHNIPLVYETRAFWEDAAVENNQIAANSLRYRVTRGLENRVFKQADGIITICQGLRDDLISRGINHQKITVVANGVDLAQFPLPSQPVPELRHQWRIDSNRFVLAFIGSFYPYEGLAWLIEQMPVLVSRYPNLLLLLVGGGPEENPLHQRVNALGLQQAVHFTGRVPHDQVPQLYQLADAMIYPRLSSRLTELVTPLKPLEAMAQQKAVVATAIGGHRELIHHGQTGLLFDEQNSDSLLGQLDCLLSQPDYAQTLGQQGRQWVTDHRQWQQNVRHYQPLYQQLTKGRKP